MAVGRAYMRYLKCDWSVYIASPSQLLVGFANTRGNVCIFSSQSSPGKARENQSYLNVPQSMLYSSGDSIDPVIEKQKQMRNDQVTRE